VKWTNINELCDVVRETSFAIHAYHRNGHLEKVYQNALVHRLRKQGLKASPHHPLAVYDEDGTVLGEYFADLFVEDALILELKACKLELKACKSVSDEHIAQILGYLKSARIETGLLINFGAAKLYVKKYLMSASS
jgi:GxxExxY protein